MYVCMCAYKKSTIKIYVRYMCITTERVKGWNIENTWDTSVYVPVLACLTNNAYIHIV